MKDRGVHPAFPRIVVPPAIVVGPLRRRLRNSFEDIYFEMDVIAAVQAAWPEQPEYGDPDWHVVRENGLLLAYRPRYERRDEEWAAMGTG